MKHSLSPLLFLALFVSACAPAVTPPAANEPRTLTVFAAASLTDAFTEIGKNFESANPSATVRFSFAGSQTLRTQIEQGAPVDVFASANAKEMDALVTDSLVTKDSPRIFLTNKLIIILPPNNPAGLEDLEDLARPGLKLVMAAEDVPVGKYARQALDKMDASFGGGFKDKVLAGVVSNEEDVKQVVAKIQLGEGDAGIVYTSDAVAAPGLKTIEIPADLNAIASYPIAALTNSANPDLASAFIAYVLSPDGQAVLKKWGFGPVQ